MNTNNFDCRTIRKGLVCEHLSPWNTGRKEELAHVCTCKALNIVLFPEYKDLGKITQELIKVQPVFHCPILQKFRANDKAPKMVATIDKNNFKTWNNDKKL